MLAGLFACYGVLLAGPGGGVDEVSSGVGAGVGFGPEDLELVFELGAEG